jgi:NAD(P)-dependent dehydrogenase (short-subunit alcohol dehydrogenase family)
VLVTGAASGIGLAAALLFAARGWRVHGLDRLPCPAGLRPDGWTRCDLDDIVALPGVLKDLRAQPLDALVCCAGVAGTGDPQRVLRINFLATRQITRTLAPTLADGGGIVLVSSGAGMKWPQRVDTLRYLVEAPDTESLSQAAAQCGTAAEAYILSKELLSFLGAYDCQREWGRGVRLNVVSPGNVDTPLIPAFTASMGADAMAFARSVAGRDGQPGEVAEAICFLASRNAAWINGAELRVDGGLTGALASGAVGFPGWR